MASVPKLHKVERFREPEPALPSFLEKPKATAPVGFARRRVEAQLNEAGICIGGQHPWDIHVHDGRFFRRVLLHGSLGLGESYMDGWWDCEALDSMFTRLLQAQMDDGPRGLAHFWLGLRARLFNLQHGGRAWHVGRQ